MLYKGMMSSYPTLLKDPSEKLCTAVGDVFKWSEKTWTNTSKRRLAALAEGLTKDAVHDARSRP
jgi:hypothetical protein